jgi:hypothetical protein
MKKNNPVLPKRSGGGPIAADFPAGVRCGAGDPVTRAAPMVCRSFRVVEHGVVVRM